MFNFIFKVAVILLFASVFLYFTLPIRVLGIDEKQILLQEYSWLIDVLPDNKTFIWTASLPEAADKIIIKKIAIDLSEQRMFLYENKKMIKEFLVSTGMPGMETPIGEFQIKNKFPKQWSKAAGLWMPYWMAVATDGRFGIHELPEWPNGIKEGEDHLGQPVSHGCIRLGIGAAKEVYEWAEVGVRVEIEK
jgi:hypothetical protein